MRKVKFFRFELNRFSYDDWSETSSEHSAKIYAECLLSSLISSDWLPEDLRRTFFELDTVEKGESGQMTADTGTLYFGDHFEGLSSDNAPEFVSNTFAVPHVHT